MKKIVNVLLLTVLVVSSFSVGAFAAGNTVEIKAQLNQGIKINYNGEQQTFKDTNGNVVYPISYNGTTYLPVRAVSNLVNLPVNWDGATNTIDLGTVEKQPFDLTKDSQATSTKYSWIIRNEADRSVSGSDANITFKSGVAFDIWNNTASVDKTRVMYFSTKGNETLEFTAWTNGNSTEVFVFNENYEVLNKFALGANESKKIKMDIKGVSKVAFGANSSDRQQSDKILKIFEPTAY